MYPSARILPALFVLCSALLPGQGSQSPSPHTQLPQERTDTRPSPTAKQAKEDSASKQAEAEKPIVITATRQAEDIFDTPFEASLVRPGEGSPSRTLQDTIRDIPGVHIQRTSYGQISPFLRGFTGYHTLMLVDGIRLNNSVLRSGPNEYWGLVDPFSTERIEVVMGPGSVLYGSDAVGGVVNAIPTRRHSFEEGTHGNVRSVFRYSTAEASLVGRLQVEGNVNGDLGISLGVTGASYGDLDAGGDLGRQRHTSYSAGFVDGAIDIFLDDRWSLDLLFQGGRLNDVRRTHKTVFGVPYHGTTVGSDLRRSADFERELGAVTLRGTDLESFFQEAVFRVSFQRIEENQDRVRSNLKRRRQGFDVNTLGVMVQFTSDTDFGLFTYGADWYHDFVDSYKRDFDAMGGLTSTGVQGPVADDASYDLLGIFVQDQLPLGEHFDLLLGARFTYAAADADKVADPVSGAEVSLEDDWTSLVGSARVLWKPEENARVWAGVSQAFRAPNLSDLTRFDSARSNEIEVPAPGLDPEDFITFELGARLRWKGLEAEAAYFITRMNDVIIRQPTPMMIGMETVVTKRNAGDGIMQGITLNLRYDIDENWWLYGGFSWLDSHIETFPDSSQNQEEEVTSRLPPIQGLLGAGWRTDDGSFSIMAEARIVDRQDRLNTRDKGDTQRIPPGGTPGYTIYNIHARYRIDERSHVFLSLENLTDKNYRTHGSGVQEPGFNAIMGFDMTF